MKLPKTIMKSKRKHGDKLVILVVDDDDSTQEVMKIVLTDSGYVYIGASSTGQVYDILHNIVPDLIIMDYYIGSDNGVKLIEWLREDNNCHEVPVLFSTAADEIPKKVGAFKNCDIMYKPFEVNDLIEKIEKLLKRG